MACPSVYGFGRDNSSMRASCEGTAARSFAAPPSHVPPGPSPPRTSLASQQPTASDASLGEAGDAVGQDGPLAVPYGLPLCTDPSAGGRLAAHSPQPPSPRPSSRPQLGGVKDCRRT